ncbi:hypothetical protein BASA62_001305 [Batrachochytrium salamandrivorans]|nr:hypothetical protein BASA62_001305 [Batrachochytrium salamandrivorans]
MAKDKSGATNPGIHLGHRWIDGSVESASPVILLSYDLFSRCHHPSCCSNAPVLPPFVWVPTASLKERFTFDSTQLRRSRNSDSYLSRNFTKLHMARNTEDRYYHCPRIFREKSLLVCFKPTVDLVRDQTIHLMGERASAT